MTDPTKVPVQFNVMIPWDFKDFLKRKAEHDRTSQNQLAVDALMDKYGVEFARKQTKAPK